MGKLMQNHIADRKSDLATAVKWLRERSSTAALLERLQTVIESELSWEGALPCTNSPLDTPICASNSRPQNVTVIGVDGSQIFPDRHAAVLYYLIQCGALIYRYNSGIPEPRGVENLYFEDAELFDAYGFLISNDTISKQRTVEEMLFVADLSENEHTKYPDIDTYALIDGPLLWPYQEREQHISPEFKSYISALNHIKETGVVPVGYVDRPGGKWFLNTLWANQLSEQQSFAQLEPCPLRSLTDLTLMEFILAAGERTPWFKRHYRSQTLHNRFDMEIWFCYMNMGDLERPSIARIETLKQFAQSKQVINSLQCLLLHQSRALNGYPYVLARAHEQALVTTQDKAALDALLERKLMEHGIMPRMSEKARQKSYLGYR
jgi:hypothetical protein